jgi:hypothetical protein
VRLFAAFFRMAEPFLTSPTPVSGWQLPAEPIVPGAAAGRSRQRRRWRIAWASSGLSHLLASGAVVGYSLAAILFFVPAPQASRHVELAGVMERADDDPLPALATLPIHIKDDVTARAVADEQIAHLARHMVSPELEERLLGESDSARDGLASAWVQARVADEIAAAEKLTREDQLQQLARLAGTLDRVSSAESVDAIAARLQALLGTGERAQQPATEPVAGEFDHETAQLHDVRRTADGQGGFTYVGVLLDAQGRTSEAPLDAAEGENLFRIMELIKSNPLLERVYRSVVMSLLDKMLKPASAPLPPVGDAPPVP